MSPPPRRVLGPPDELASSTPPFDTKQIDVLPVRKVRKHSDGTDVDCSASQSSGIEADAGRCVAKFAGGRRFVLCVHGQAAKLPARAVWALRVRAVRVDSPLLSSLSKRYQSSSDHVHMIR